MRSQRSGGAFLLAVLLAFTLLACSETPAWNGTIEMQEGVEVLSNPGVPLLQSSRSVASELWSVKGSDWVDPTRVHVHQDVVTVVDPPANQVHRVSILGEEEASLGAPGEGPGEFLRLLDAIPDGERLAVLDGGRSSVQYLDPDGDYLFSIHLDGQPWGGFLTGDGKLLVKGEFLSDPAQESFGDWVFVAEDHPPVAFTSLPLDPLPEEEGVRCSDLSPWADRVARMRFTVPQIELFDATGNIRREIRIDLPIEVVSEPERKAALSQLEESLVGRGLPPPFIQQDLVVMEERWRVKCRFGPLRSDASGRYAAFLEENPDEFGSGPATLHVLSGDGVYLARVPFPDPWRDFTVENGILYALVRDPDTDIITLRAYRLDLPTSVMADAAEMVQAARQRLVPEG